MRYEEMIKGKFVARPNRFIAHIEIDGKTEICHVKNTGRCKELLPPGATVWCEKSQNPARKTAFDLICAKKGNRLINMDSQAPNAIAAEWLPLSGLFHEDAVIRREVTYGASRFDFCIENADGQGGVAYLEVKGCTLEREGIALFPDAPTERGVKHLRELAALAGQGVSAYVLFVIQMKGIHLFRPNDETHKAFGDALREASAAGVRILAVDCRVAPGIVTADEYIPVDLLPISKGKKDHD